MVTIPIKCPFNKDNIGPFFDTTIDLEVPYHTNPDFEYFPSITTFSSASRSTFPDEVPGTECCAEVGDVQQIGAAATAENGGAVAGHPNTSEGYSVFC